MFKEKSIYFKLGVLFLVLAPLSAISLLLYYNYTGFIRDLKIDTVIAAITNLPIMIATVGGAFFVIDNLILQRIAISGQNDSLNKQTEAITHQITALELQRNELELQRKDIKLQIEESKKSNEYYAEQNKIMRHQQNEATFFVLIELHKKLFLELNTGNENFHVLKLEIMEYSRKYINSLQHELFDPFTQTHLNPYYILNIDRKKSTENLQIYIENVKDIISFIHYNLNNSNFYHKKFYNLMSSTEKYFVGLCQSVNIYEFYEFATPSSSRHNYSTYYLNLDNSYTLTKGYVPVMNIDKFRFIPNSNFESPESNFLLKISILENLYKINPIVKELKVYIRMNNIHMETMSLMGNEEYFDNGEYILDYKKVLQQIKKISGANSQQGFGTNLIFQLTYDFSLNYGNYNYIVSHKMGFNLGNSGFITNYL